MASFALDEFVGNGPLFPILDKLVAEGWDDVPTIKVMNSSDMDALQLTQEQRDSLDIRTYLHNRALLEYAEKLEASGKSIAELLNVSPAALVAEYGMKRGHVARFTDRGAACGIVLPKDLTKTEKAEAPKPAYDEPKEITTEHALDGFADSARKEEPAEFKGIVASVPAPSRACGLIKPPPVVEDVTPLAVLEQAQVIKLLPEHKVGLDPWKQNGSLQPPPKSRAADLWKDQTTILYCLRRPGCVMCRAEAHQLYSNKPIFDALNVQLVAVLNEYIDPEVKAFWPRYWGGQVVADPDRELFKALGGGKLLKDSLIVGFLLNPLAKKNFKRASATPGIEYNLKGEGTIKGGLYIVRSGKGGVAYQFVERTFGDWAPVEEVIAICKRLNKGQRQ